jgi:hypothetical protein
MAHVTAQSTSTLPHWTHYNFTLRGCHGLKWSGMLRAISYTCVRNPWRQPKAVTIGGSSKVHHQFKRSNIGSDCTAVARCYVGYMLSPSAAAARYTLHVGVLMLGFAGHSPVAASCCGDFTSHARHLR